MLFAKVVLQLPDNISFQLKPVNTCHWCKWHQSCLAQTKRVVFPHFKIPVFWKQWLLHTEAVPFLYWCFNGRADSVILAVCWCAWICPTMMMSKHQLPSLRIGSNYYFQVIGIYKNWAILYFEVLSYVYWYKFISFQVKNSNIVYEMMFFCVLPYSWKGFVYQLWSASMVVSNSSIRSWKQNVSVLTSVGNQLQCHVHDWL